MHFKRNKTSKLPLILILLLSVVSPSYADSQLIKTWDFLGEAVPPQICEPELEALPPARVLVWSGTVSHHLLAEKQIDSWFGEIAKRRKVKTFFIICPSHYGLSAQNWSLDNICWQTKKGPVYTDEEIESQLARALGVTYESQVFPEEHGVNVLIPYISQYFPKACKPKGYIVD